MPSNYPTNYDSFPDPNANTPLNDPTYNHANMHSNENDAIAAIEHFIGKTGAVNFDLAGAAATAQSVAESYAAGLVSTETTRAEAAEALLATIHSPVLTGSPTAPTPLAGSNNNQIATTAFVESSLVATGYLIGETANISHNTTLGYAALGITSPNASDSTSGQFITAIGYETLQLDKSGNYHTAIGAMAMQDATPAQGSDVAIGYQALQYDTVGLNTAVGMQALGQSHIGKGNVAIGNQALYFDATPQYNVAIGYEAMQFTQAITGNIAIGYQALQNDILGSNIAIGYQALNVAATPNYSIAIGYHAMNQTPGAHYGIAIGNSALAWDRGLNNIAIGSSSNATIGLGSATPNYTIAIGGNIQALASGTIAIGVDSLGNSAIAATPNHFVLGTSNHIVDVPGYIGSSLAIGGAGSYGYGAGPMLFLANTIYPPIASPTGGGILYVQNGALKYIGSSGTITLIANA